MAKMKVTKSSGNVFADIGVPNAKEHAAKADLVMSISRTIKKLSLTQVEAASRVGVDQPEISKILRGHFRPISIERLALMLTRLGKDVTT